MEIKIRNYTQNDAQSILSIINFNILNTVALYDYEIRTLEQQMKILDEKLQKKFPIIVAEKDGVCIGFGMFSEFRFRQAYQFTVEHSVYVAHENNGQGVGKLLLEQLIVLAKKQGYHTMIGVIDSENKNSIAFHQKFGFEIVGIIKDCGYKFNRWLDTVFMQLLLK